MPYQSTDELPDSIQKLPAQKQRQWMEVFNSVFYKCQEEGGDDCEAAAFRQANGVIADMAVDPNVGGGVDRSKLKDSDFVFPDTRSFPIVTPGDVEDAVSSWGRYKGGQSFETFRRRLTALAKRKGASFVARLPESWKEEKEMENENILFIELTGALLAADKPFDGLAAGEFVDMHGRKVKITEEDLAEIVANTQALIETTRGENGELAGLPIDSQSHEKGNASGWIMGLELAGNVIRLIPQWTEIGRELIEKKIQKYFSATIDLANKILRGGTLTNWPATRDQKGQILLRPIELSQELLQIQIEQAEKPPKLIEQEKKMNDEVQIPETVLAELRAQMKREILTELAPPKDDETAEQAMARLKEQLNLSAFADVADLGQAREAMLKQMQGALKSEYERMQANAGKYLAEMMQQIKREQHIGELSQRLTGGDEKYPRGLPVGREEVETFLSDLNDKQRAAAESILTRTIEQGLMEFAEIGHGKKIKGGRQLDPQLAGLLKKHLDAGGELAAWFELADIGAMDEYDLSAFDASTGSALTSSVSKEK